MDDPIKTVIAGLFFTGLGYWQWRKGMRNRSHILGTPTSTIATAAKGFVELSGRARPVCAAPLLDPITDQPCLWFKIVSEERKGWLSTEWKTVGTAKSSRPIVIQDDTASCAVLGDINEGKADRVIRESYMLRHNLWHICNGDRLYVLGHIEHLGSRHDLMKTYAQHDEVAADARERYRKLNEHTSGIMRLWKQDEKRMIARFDADNDGRLDAAEWNKARDSAQEIARNKLSAGASEQPFDPEYLPFESITHWVRKPADGRTLVVAKGSEADFAKRQRGSSWAGLAMFIFGVVILVAMLRDCVGP